jgi:hypothetical protein
LGQKKWVITDDEGIDVLCRATLSLLARILEIVLVCECCKNEKASLEIILKI